MEGRTTAAVTLSPRQRQVLEEMVARRNCAQGLALRACLILLAGDGADAASIAGELHSDETTVRRWRRRWVQAAAAWDATETQDWDEQVWPEKIQDALADRQRSGCPGKFTAEQV